MHLVNLLRPSAFILMKSLQEITDDSLCNAVALRLTTGSAASRSNAELLRSSFAIAVNRPTAFLK
jgi:hypothetical protein